MKKWYCQKFISTLKKHQKWNNEAKRYLFLFVIDVIDNHLFKEIVVRMYFMIIWISE